MAFHIKSTTKFKILIGFSAFTVSGVAALFSVTGVSSLFRGSFYAVVAMMTILEFAKIIVASYAARYWNTLAKTIRTYFTLAVIVLMVITSAGIFGYLSEAYQGTKGNYDVTEQESTVLTAKKKNYEEQIQRYKDRVTTLNSFRASQEVRLDSLYSRGLTTSAKRVEQGILRNDNEVQSLNDKISALTDSVGSIGTQIVTKQTVNIKGELGPLKFIATAFNTDMDTIVKYLILMLIFVFDPLAVLLFVSLSAMIRKEADLEAKSLSTENEVIPPIELVQPVRMPPSKIVRQPIKVEEAKIVETIPPPTVIEEESPEEKELKEVVENLTIESSPVKVDEVEEILPVIEEPEPTVVEEPPKVNLEEVTKEHEFYYGEEKKEELPVEPTPPPPEPLPPPPPGPPPPVEWHTANWKPPHK